MAWPAAWEGFVWRRTLILATLAGMLLSGCAVQAPQPPESKAERPSGFPADFYQRAAARGSPVFAIDASVSLVVIEVHRGGSLARVGHDHVIASHGVRGYVAPNEGRADLYIRLDELIVDEPDLRAQAAFDSQPTEAAIAGTRENMLRQLNAVQYPYAVISVAGVDGAGADRWLSASIAVNGIARAVRIPAKLEQTADELTVNGVLALEQTDFAIVPLAILGGAIQVQDRVAVRFAINARRLQA